MAQHSTRPRQRSRVAYFSHVAAFLFGMIVATMSLTFFQGTILHATQDLEHFAGEHLKVDNVLKAQMAIIPQPQAHISMGGEHHSTHGVAGLDCSTYGGPASREATQELVYWKDLSLDNQFVSPLQSKEEKQYLTFEPDGGGWNNIRMSMETVLAMAVATGRVLVLPPSQKMYLLGKSSFSFADFFPLQEIATEHAGLEIITTKQFLAETDGKVRDVKTGKITYPPKERTDWDGDTDGVKKHLNPWLQTIAPNPDWNPDKCLAAFPKSRDPKDSKELQDIFNELQKDSPTVESFINQPTPVNATAKERMAEFMAERKELCLYNPELQQAQIIHFHGKKNLGGRLLVHFYAFLYFQDWRTDLWMKRFVRDHVRYVDETQCAAARVIEAVREHSRKTGNDGVFDAFHIRRGDFQYQKTRVEADKIISVAKDQIPKGSTVYVGTDERQKEFFKEMTDYWDVLFLDDFIGLLNGLNKNHFGMLDQLVTSRGRFFFGCWFSTFTGYITRLRGYASQIVEEEGYEMGLLPSTFYYVLEINKNKLHDYWPIKKLFYAREYPASWRNIDFEM